jgi:hypothetical protein
MAMIKSSFIGAGKLRYGWMEGKSELRRKILKGEKLTLERPAPTAVCFGDFGDLLGGFMVTNQSPFESKQHYLSNHLMQDQPQHCLIYHEAPKMNQSKSNALTQNVCSLSRKN